MTTDFPTVEEMDARTRKLAADGIDVRTLGKSRSGRSIDLVSIGDGPISALFVGAPHPNEPAGCATTELLIERLLAGTMPRGKFRWHVIKAIDIDGVAMNQGWLKGPRTFASYTQHFFRPAFHRQPEYAFPLTAGGYTFGDATPETQCWQRALDIAKPQLQASLHGSEFGGAFFLTTEAIPALTEKISAAVAETGLGLNTVGDTGYWEQSYAPAFFPLHSLAEPGRLPADWRAGNSSCGYARDRFGTFSLMPEVPLWTGRILFEESETAFSLGDVATLARTLNAEIASTLARDLPRLARRPLSGDDHELELALEQAERGAKVAGAPSNERPVPGPCLTRREYALRALKIRMALVRPFAMLRRLAQSLADRGDTDAKAIATAAQTTMSGKLTIIRKEAGLEPVPTEVLAGLQLDAILTSAEAIAARG
jgi:hypothetical protein